MSAAYDEEVFARAQQIHEAAEARGEKLDNDAVITQARREMAGKR